MVFVFADIPLEQIIAGDEHIAFLIQQHSPGCSCPGKGNDFEIRREAAEFLRPVIDD